MKLAQIVASDLSPLEAREQRLDLSALQPLLPPLVVTVDARGRSTDPPRRPLEALLAESEATVAHLYGRSLLTRRLLGRIAVPVVAQAAAPPSRVPWLRARQPDAVLDGASSAPAVPAEYFQSGSANPGARRVGVLVRDEEATRAVTATRQRIERFREDIRWSLFRAIPDPSDMRQLGAWIDPTPDRGSGGLPEAMAAGVPVIAARTGFTVALLADGEAGFLIPPGDANELAHAILATLFKPELTAPKRRRAFELAELFRPERRAEMLLRIYRELSR